MASPTPGIAPEAAPEADALRPRPFRMPRIVLALMLREMATSYGRSPGGYLWAVVIPLGGVMMLTLIMSVGLQLRNPALGINFPLFYATGLLTLMLYQNTASVVGTALIYSRPLLRYPGVTFVDALLARLILQAITKAVVMYLIFGGLMLVFETRAILDLPAILLAFAMATAVGFGVGCLNGYLFPVYPLWERAWGILTFPMFLLSGVFFLYENLPMLGQQILWFNPVLHATGQMRTGFYPTYHPDYISPAYVFGFALVPAVLGLMLLRRHHKWILNR
jgi:capsular polysaccharide transport system permease protein